MDVLASVIGLKKLIRVRQEWADQALKEYGLSLFHVQYLLLIERLEGEATLKELTDLMNTNKSNTTRAVTKLVNKGYVKKVSSDKRIRGYQLTVTKKGKEVVMVASNILNEHHEMLISYLHNEEEEKQLIYLIEKLIRNLRNEFEG